MVERIIQMDRSVIPACDVDFGTYELIAEATQDNPKISALKVGVAFLDVGLKAVVKAARRFTDIPIIYDHQKAGTDVPHTSKAFMDAMVRAGVNAVILFPQAGPITQYEWTKAAMDRNLGVIVGGEMTHPRYLATDTANPPKGPDYTAIFRELGIDKELRGYIREWAPEDMYELAARMGVIHFVVPGNKPDQITHFRGIIEAAGVDNADYMSPGLILQGGDIGEGAEAAGNRFHGIAGRAIYEKAPGETKTLTEMKEAMQELTSKI